VTGKKTAFHMFDPTARCVTLLAILTGRNARDAFADLALPPARTRLEKRGHSPDDTKTLKRLAPAGRRSKSVDDPRPIVTFTVYQETAVKVRALAALENKAVHDVVEELVSAAADRRLKSLGIDPEAVRAAALKFPRVPAK
jgi:hypothetical protein